MTVNFMEVALFILLILLSAQMNLMSERIRNLAKYIFKMEGMNDD